MIRRHIAALVHWLMAHAAWKKAHGAWAHSTEAEKQEMRALVPGLRPRPKR